MKIYLVTHAHTEALPGVAIDTWQLSARGEAEARALAGRDFWHDVDRVIVSSEPKAWLTVAGVAESRNLPIWVDSRFDELRRHGWVEDYAARVAEVLAYPSTAVGGWEPAASVRRRALTALSALRDRFTGETLAVVGHGLCLSILRSAILGESRVDFDAWQRLAFGSHATIFVSPLAMLQDFTFSNEVTR
jgi:broad specificity phosphatase PhoE